MTIPRLLECRECGHEWRAVELCPCPACSAARVRSRCGAKTSTTGEPCRGSSVYGNGRCRRHGGRKSAMAEGSNRDVIHQRRSSLRYKAAQRFGAAMVRAAAHPELRDLTRDHALAHARIDELVELASAGLPGPAAWAELAKIFRAMQRAMESKPSALPGLVEAGAALAAGQLKRSDAWDEVERWERLRVDMLEKEAKIQHLGQMAIPVVEVHTMMLVMVNCARQVLLQDLGSPEDRLASFARRIRALAPGSGLNTEADLDRVREAPGQ